MRVHELVKNIRAKPFGEGDDLIENSVKFDLGDIGSVNEMACLSSGEMCKPPFPVSLFQFETKDDSYIALVKDTGEGVDVYGYGFQPKIEGAYWYKENLKIRTSGYDANGSASIINLRTGKPVDSEWLADGGDAKAWWIGTLYAVLNAMEVLACSNIEYIDNPCPKYINAKRKKKGKVPFFSYKTLHLIANNNEVKSKTEGGGTHASPRIHLRRGHIRKLQSGKRIWVQPCVVGDRSKGMMTKDYSVSLH